MADSTKRNRALLEQIVKDKIQLDPVKEALNLRVRTKVVKIVIETAKEKSPEFKEVFYGKYDGGSYFDKLQVKSSIDFDDNIIIKIPPTSWKLTDLADDQTKPNFAFMGMPEPGSKSWVNISDDRAKIWKSLVVKNRMSKHVISPKKVYEMLHTAVTKSLTALNHKVTVDNITYKVTRRDGGPVVLNIEGPSVNSKDKVKFKVDLVPAFQLQMKHRDIDSELVDRVNHVMEVANIDTKICPTFMAIAIHDTKMFELDFHDIERALLKSRGGCIYDVIMLIKHIRNSKGGNLTKLWSHLLKTSVMHRAMETDPVYWRKENIETCFIDCIKNLTHGLKNASITDLFFPKFNFLDRLEEDPLVMENSANFLDKITKKYEDTMSLADFFHGTKPIPRFHCNSCDVTMNSAADLESHNQGKQHQDKEDEASVEADRRLGFEVSFPGKLDPETGNIQLNAASIVEALGEKMKDFESSIDLIESQTEAKTPEVSISPEQILKSLSADAENKRKSAETKLIVSMTINNEKRNDNKHFCKPCGKSITGAANLEAHNKSKNHSRAARKIEIEEQYLQPKTKPKKTTDLKKNAEVQEQKPDCNVQ